jgi:hypothetical protein
MPAELTLRDGYPWPDDLPRGTVAITSLPGAAIRIDHADPRVLVSAELLDAIADKSSPHAWLDVARCSTYDGAVLHIEAVNRTVIYRITGYVPAVHGYIAEWPD